MNGSYRQCQANILKQTEPKIVHKSTKTDSNKHTLIIYYLVRLFLLSSPFPFFIFRLIRYFCCAIFSCFLTSSPSSPSLSFPHFRFGNFSFLLLCSCARQSQYYKLLYKTKTEKMKNAHTLKRNGKQIAHAMMRARDGFPRRDARAHQNNRGRGTDDKQNKSKHLWPQEVNKLEVV